MGVWGTPNNYFWESNFVLNINCIVLAGGKSSRFGRNKALEQLGGASIISRVAGALDGLGKETYLVVSQDYADLAELKELCPGAKIVTDRYKAKGPLVGVYSGLIASSELYNYVVACDMPLMSGCVLAYMAGLAKEYDAVVPRINGKPEPLCAIYSKMCIPVMEEMIFNGELRLSRLLEKVKVRYVDENEIEPLDPGFLSFHNVNTEEDLKQIEKMVCNFKKES